MVGHSEVGHKRASWKQNPLPNADCETGCGIRDAARGGRIELSGRTSPAKIVCGHAGPLRHPTRAQLMRCLSFAIDRIRMFPLGNVAEKRLREKETSLRHKHSRSRPTRNAGREPFPRQGASKAVRGVLPLPAQGVLRGEVRQNLDLLLLNAENPSARGHSVGRSSACCWGKT